MKTLIYYWSLATLLSASVSAATWTVEMHDDPYRFVPADLTVNLGDTVRWINRSPFMPHATISDVGPWDSDLLFEDESFSFTFTRAGDYPYYDYYPGVTGIIRVMGALNQPPTVALTSPTNGATFAAPGAFTVTATAGDPDGSVTNVQFLVGASAIGNRMAPPYTAPVANLSAGSHLLTAQATDNRGLSVTSAPVTISVVAPAELRLLPPVVSPLQVVVSFTTTPQLTYVLEAAAHPAGEWTALRTNVATAAWTHVTNAAPAATQQCYRACLVR